MSLPPCVEEPNSEVKKLINVFTWTTVSSPVNVLCIWVFKFVHVPLDWDIIAIIWLWLLLWVYNNCSWCVYNSQYVFTTELFGRHMLESMVESIINVCDVTAINGGAWNARVLRRCFLYSSFLLIVSLRIQWVKISILTLEPGIVLLC